MTELGGGVAVVTGGASGVGRALAERFARERAKGVVADIDQRALAAGVDSIKARGGAALGGLAARRGPAVYNTAKSAVVGPPGTRAKDLRPSHSGVPVLCPRGVATQTRESARNRPADLTNEAPGAVEPVELMGRTLAPAAVA